VTVDPSKLQVILDRVSAQQLLSQEEQGVLAAALQAGKITLADGDRAVAIGGNADNAVIVTGDRNILISKEMGQALQEKIQGAGNVEQQFGDRQTTINNIFILGNEPTAIQAQQQQQVSLLLQQLPLEVLQRAYRDVLPADAYLDPPQMTNPEEIVANLQDFRRLPDFVQKIVADEQQPQMIRDKLSQTIDLPKSSQPITKPVAVLQSYLLITVRRKQDTDGFVVNGWLIPDDAVRDRTQRFHPLDIDPTQKGKECNLSQMPQVVDELIQLSLEHLLGKQFELTIEMFLPLDYLHEGIDEWKIVDLDEEIPIGTTYRVVVRTYDRLTPKYLKARLNSWYKNWERVKGTWDNTPDPDNDFEILDDYSDINWKRLEDNLTQKLGLKLTCGLLEEHREGVIKAVYRSATPIAIWPRCSFLNLDLMSEINTLISSRCLADLSEAIRQKRQAAESEDEPEKCLGKHLTILWEDPYRLPPDVAQLIPAGQ
jgi:hypothetical protein